MKLRGAERQHDELVQRLNLTGHMDVRSNLEGLTISALNYTLGNELRGLEYDITELKELLPKKQNSALETSAKLATLVLPDDLATRMPVAASEAAVIAAAPRATATRALG